MLRIVLIAAAALAAAGAPASAQTPQEAPAETVGEPPAAPAPAAPRAEEEDRVIVRGTRIDRPRMQEWASDFVLEIGDPTSSQRGYARWGRRVCVGVENAPEELAQFVVDRISATNGFDSLKLYDIDSEEKKRGFLHFNNNTPKQDGSYTIQLFTKDSSIKKPFGYYSNGLPLVDSYDIILKKDNIYIKEDID